MYLSIIVLYLPILLTGNLVQPLRILKIARFLSVFHRGFRTFVISSAAALGNSG